jgi:hygromycin-B 7''-O-kinase
VQERIAGCVARHREQGLSEQWLEQLPTFLASAQPLYPPSFKPSLISGDIHQWHLMVKEQGGRWRITGLFDFDDAFVGFPEYDLAAASLFVMHGRATLLRTFLLSYGYPEPDLTTALSKRFMAYTLLHRYRPLNWILEEFVADPSCTTLDQLATTIYPL